MRDGALAGTLLCAALGMPLGITQAKTRVWSVSTLVVSALVTHLTLSDAHIRPDWADALFLNSWISVVGSALCVYLARPVGLFAALVLSLNAGIWCGAVNALATGSQWWALQSLPAVAILWPIGWALSATLQFLPVTPGYLPDHLE
jgi:hypothetical protein